MSKYISIHVRSYALETSVRSVFRMKRSLRRVRHDHHKCVRIRLRVASVFVNRTDRMHTQTHIRIQTHRKSGAAQIRSSSSSSSSSDIHGITKAQRAQCPPVFPFEHNEHNRRTEQQQAVCKTSPHAGTTVSRRRRRRSSDRSRSRET